MSELALESLGPRLGRLLQALSVASVGEFDNAREVLRVEHDDALAELEHTITIFLAELEQTERANAQAMREVEQSRDELQLQLETVERQRMAIRELSTPVIDLWDGIITLPIVGSVDTQRAREIGENLLDAIVARAAVFVIIDVTGMSMIDTKTADYLIRMTRSAELLGSRCVVTGIGPDVARTLAELGVDLGRVKTLRTLKDGLRDGLEYLRANAT